MIDYKDAIEILLREATGRSLDTEMLSLEDVPGRICAEQVISLISNQPFDNSAMDGFAVNRSCLADASEKNPVILDVIGRVAAGDPAPETPPAKGQCYEIMTGAPLPPGCNAIVPVERTSQDQSKVSFYTQAEMNDNIRRAGEDIAAGETVVESGALLGHQHILSLATLGIGQVKVRCKPKVGVVSTGLEIVDDLSEKLLPGQIYNASGPYLRNALPAFGADSVSYGTVADDPKVFRAKLSEMIDDKMDVIVTTGAVSAGAYDFIRSELEKAGAEVLFHKVKIRPGKPILFAKLPDDGPLFIGLPGNPVASTAGVRFFVYPLLRALSGLAPEQPQHAVLTNDYTKKAGFRFFFRAVTSSGMSGKQEVEILQKQQSFMVSAFLTANAWVMAPEDVEEMKTGEVVEIYPLYPVS